jgi:integrase
MLERLGHADIGVTLNTYTHTVSEQHKDAGVQIDTVFGA